MEFAVAGVCVGIVIWWLVQGRAKRRGDGDWAVQGVCAGCGQSVPRWFFLDKGTARGPYSFYRYAIPDRCRVCRHEKGFAPVAWSPGESETAYDARSEKIFNARARPAPPA